MNRTDRTIDDRLPFPSHRSTLLKKKLQGSGYSLLLCAPLHAPMAWNGWTKTLDQVGGDHGWVWRVMGGHEKRFIDNSFWVSTVVKEALTHGRGAC